MMLGFGTASLPSMPVGYPASTTGNRRRAAQPGGCAERRPAFEIVEHRAHAVEVVDADPLGDAPPTAARGRLSDDVLTRVGEGPHAVQVHPAVVVGARRWRRSQRHRALHGGPQHAQLGLDEGVAVDRLAVLPAQLRHHVGHRRVGAALHVEPGPQLTGVVPEHAPRPLAALEQGERQRVQHRRRVALGRRRGPSSTAASRAARCGLCSAASACGACRVTSIGAPGRRDAGCRRMSQRGHAFDRCRRHPIWGHPSGLRMRPLRSLGRSVSGANAGPGRVVERGRRHHGGHPGAVHLHLDRRALRRPRPAGRRRRSSGPPCSRSRRR